MMIPMQQRAAQNRFSWDLLVATTLFGIATIFRPDSMSPQVMGELAYSIELEAWIAGFIGSALMILYGITINGRSRWSPIFRIGGYAALAVLLSVLFYSAFSAPFGVVIWSWGVPFVLRRCLAFLRINISDAALRWRNAGH